MQNVQIGWRRIANEHRARRRQELDIADAEHDPLDRDHRQIEMKLDPLLMIESNLLAVVRRAALAGSFPSAMPVRTAAAPRLSEHEVLSAGDTTAADQCGQQKHGKKPTGQRPRHVNSSIKQILPDTLD